MIAESLKGNCSVTVVHLVSAGLLLVRLLLLTCVEQDSNEDMSDAVKREVDVITRRNKKKPKERLSEVAAMKQVFCRLCHFFLHNYKSSVCIDRDCCARIIYK